MLQPSGLGGVARAGGRTQQSFVDGILELGRVPGGGLEDAVLPEFFLESELEQRELLRRERGRTEVDVVRQKNQRGACL